MLTTAVEATVDIGNKKRLTAALMCRSAQWNTPPFIGQPAIKNASWKWQLSNCSQWQTSPCIKSYSMYNKDAIITNFIFHITCISPNWLKNRGFYLSCMRNFDKTTIKIFPTVVWNCVHTPATFAPHHAVINYQYLSRIVLSHINMKHFANPQTSLDKQKNLKVNQKSGSNFARPAEKSFWGEGFVTLWSWPAFSIKAIQSYAPNKGLPQQEGWVYVWILWNICLKFLSWSPI